MPLREGRAVQSSTPKLRRRMEPIEFRHFQKLIKLGKQNGGGGGKFLYLDAWANSSADKQNGEMCLNLSTSVDY